MAKLEGVKTLDMVNGEITKVAYNGAEYERVEGIARRVGKSGDLVLNGHKHPDLKLGEFYLLVRDEGTSLLSVRDEIDDFHGNAVTDGDSILFRKVSASQPSLEDRVSRNEKDIESLKSDVAALKGEPEAGYVRIDKSEAKAGDFVKFDEAPNRYLTAGKYYEICRVDDYGDPHIVANDGGRFDTYYAGVFEVYRKVSVAEIEKWAAIGREVGEYRIGDIVGYDDRTAFETNGFGEVVSESGGGTLRIEAVDNFGDVERYNVDPDELKLIVPVEARFDRK